MDLDQRLSFRKTLTKDPSNRHVMDDTLDEEGSDF